MRFLHDFPEFFAFLDHLEILEFPKILEFREFLEILELLGFLEYLFRQKSLRVQVVHLVVFLVLVLDTL